MLRIVGVMFGVGLIIAAAAVAAGPRNLANDLKAFKRAHHSYDNLPPQAKTLAPNVVASRRVATAVDKKKRTYYVYVAQMKDKTACIILIQGKSPTSDCLPVTLLFEPGRRETTSTANGLIGGIAQNDVKKIVLTGGSKKLTIPLTTDNGYLWGCPAPTSCAKWVRTVLGYNAAGKLVSTETVQ